jgi:hypothetical protein
MTAAVASVAITPPVAIPDVTRIWVTRTAVGANPTVAIPSSPAVPADPRARTCSFYSRVVWTTPARDLRTVPVHD